MASRESVERVVNEALGVFLARHAEYGTAGMDLDKAISLASTKLDRLRNGGALEDSSLDLIGYGIILSLLSRGLWEDGEATPDLSSKVQFKRDEKAKKYDLPGPKKEGDVGYDMYCTEETLIPGHGVVHVPSGLAMKIPVGYWAEIRPRSSAAKRGILVVPCVIDTGYTGPLFAQVYNTSGGALLVEEGERVAQIVFHRSITPEAVEVDELPETERGATGFGSTGR